MTLCGLFYFPHLSGIIHAVNHRIFFTQPHFMKRVLIPALLLVTGIAIAITLIQQDDPKPLTPINYDIGNPYDRDWKQVDSLMNKGLPKSALEIVNNLYARAMKEKNHAQIIKALIHKMGSEYTYEEEAQVKSILAIEAELPKYPFPTKPVIQSLLAQTYWRYYQDNRYRILSRTETSEFIPNDIKTWDAAKFVSKTSELYFTSLQKADSLQRTSLSVFDSILIKGNASKNFRPTLFDFLAHRALEFYMNSESGLTQPAYRFNLDASALFESAEKFATLKFNTKDTASFHYQTLLIFQRLLAFHQQHNQLLPLADNDLLRLKFVHQHATHELKDSLYLHALQKLETQFQADTFASRVGYAIAQHLFKQGSKYQRDSAPQYRWLKKEAHQKCQAVLQRYPNTIGANNCGALLGQIEEKSFTLQLEEVNVQGIPFRGLLQYQNINEVWLRAVKVSKDEENDLEGMDWKQRINFLIGKNPVQSWNQVLPDAKDYHQRSAEIKIPALPFGRYYILVASGSGLSIEEGAVAEAATTISNLGMMSRRHSDNSIHIHVFDRTTGAPLKNVDAQAFAQRYDSNTRKYVYEKRGKYKTDKDGFFSVTPSGKYENVKIELSLKDDVLFETGTYYLYRESSAGSKEWQTKTFFFLDRAIYRPGQTVYFKGLTLQTDGEKNELKKNFTVTVELLDVNYQKVSELKLVTNDFGTFNGTFALPQGLLNGNFHLRTVSGYKNFRVEDYKRPRFEVTFQPVTGSYRLNDVVTIEGKAVSYAGANISNAQVQYRVVRKATFPFWWYSWRMPFPQRESMEITNGVVTTKEDGSFSISFSAIADASIPKSQSPVFNYTVIADVTDVNGETQSSESNVSVGDVALQASINVKEVVFTNQPDSLTITVNNLNGQPENVQGTITVYPLKSPDRILRARLWGEPDTFVLSRSDFMKDFPLDMYENENRYENWERQNKIHESAFDTEKKKSIQLTGLQSWKPGMYVAVLITKDRFGNEVKAEKYFTVYEPASKAMPFKTLSWIHVLTHEAQPGEKAKLLIGSSAKDVKVLYEILFDKKSVSKQWINLNNEVKQIEIPIEEIHRGNIAVSLVFVRNGRSFSHFHTIRVPFTNKQLNIETTVFRDKLIPGQQEEWQLKISGSKGEKAAAEMLAGMYDASLDAFAVNDWNFSIYNEHYYYGFNWEVNRTFRINASGLWYENWNKKNYILKEQQYDRLNWFYLKHFDMFTYGWYDNDVLRSGVVANAVYDRAEIMEETVMTKSLKSDDQPPADRDFKFSEQEREDDMTSEKKPAVSPRVNLNETAFFFPHLKTDEAGNIIFSFTMPEALTRWKFMGFAHTQDLKLGFITKETVTQKELMVTPNAPRFFREGDRITFSAKVDNLSEKDLSGKAQLFLFDALTMQPVDALFENAKNEIPFSAKKGLSAAVSWNLKIPEGVSAIIYRVLAAAENFTDGEENALPVLSNRMLVTESLPLNVRSGQTINFKFNKLSESGKSKTLMHHKLTLEFTSNPAWNAVQALPYMMEYPYDCSEQIFNRLYANTIASGIANSSPRIQQVFESWKNIGKEALVSNLEKNQELKSLLLEETPWVLNAKDETERKKRVALLFDLNRMASEKQTALRQLRESQSSNGGWPWFKGMPDNRYITQYIVAGFGKLNKMQVLNIKQEPQTSEMLQRAIKYLDARMLEDYNELKKIKTPLENDNLGYMQAHYLYTRTMFPEITMNKEQTEAFQYYLGQAEKFWLKRNKYSQGMLALALFRQGKTEAAKMIARSLKETSLSSEELGMYWRDNSGGYYWYQAPIETQALLIETFKEMMDDKKSVDEMRIWLLKQKQTQDWGSTKATADACYALLLDGTKWLDDSKLADITIGGIKIEPVKMGAAVEAGTGYFKTSWDKSEIKPGMADISVTKTGEGIGWGAVYWQYFEQLDKITPAETPLKLKKQLFVQRPSDKGPVITPLTDKTKLEPGDLIKVRIELRVDRDMEFVHMKDMRAAGFEPVNVLSGYRWQGGLGYYETTRDAATNFFFDRLPKGTFVFEYPLRVAQRGDFSNGVTTIQCMYAPEFTSHSEGVRVKVE